MNNHGTYYNLPSKVFFCKNCVISNQRPSSVPEFKHTRNRDGAHYIEFNEEGVCEGCEQGVIKEKQNYLSYAISSEELMDSMIVLSQEAEERIAPLLHIF